MADQAKFDSERLDEASARRLIERATELDAKMKSQSTVADLREAAISAGISAEAFQRALIEVQHAPPPEKIALEDMSRQHRRLKAFALVGVAVIIAVLGLLTVVIPSRLVVNGQDRVANEARGAPARPIDFEEARPTKTAPAPTKTAPRATKKTQP